MFHRTSLRVVAALLAVVPVLSACGGGDADVEQQVERLETAQARPQLLVPGLVSTPAPEFATTFTPDGSVYFNRASADRSELVILRSDRVDGRWTEPAPASFSGEHRDLDPFASPDGSRLYFTSDRPAGSGGAAGNFDTWYVEAVDDGWGEPRLAEGPVNTDAMEFFPSVTEEGALYFQSNRDGTMRIYRASAVDGGFGEPEVVGFAENTDGGAGNPLIAPDGAYLVFAAELPDGRGGSDLFFVCRDGEGWGTARSLTAVNSEFADFAPGFSPDHAFLFFTSERPGVAPPPEEGRRPPGDIYGVAVDALGIDCG